MTTPLDFGWSGTQQALVAEVEAVLAATPSTADSREYFRRLGDARLVAVHWPEEFGGRSLTLADHAAVVERVGLQCVTEDVHLVTVQGVGCTVLLAGSREQCHRWLPGIATGRVFASLLLSEEEAGGDVASIQTTAVRDGDDWIVIGEKTWNLHADWSSFGLCAARTRETGDAYHAVSLLLIPFSACGVVLTPLQRAAGDPYFRVQMEEVRVPGDALVGSENGGWSPLVRAIGFERAGFDYLVKAQRWLNAAKRVLERLPAPDRFRARAEHLRLTHAVDAARALAYRAASLADGLDMDDVMSAYSKLACGEAAQAVAWWAGEALGDLVGQDSGVDAGTLRHALAEAPELSISGGASELQLDVIATEQHSLGVRA